MNAIIDEAPTLVSSNANGKKFVVSGVSPPLSVLHMCVTMRCYAVGACSLLTLWCETRLAVLVVQVWHAVRDGPRLWQLDEGGNQRESLRAMRLSSVPLTCCSWMVMCLLTGACSRASRLRVLRD